MDLTNFPKQAVRFGVSVTGVRRSSHSSVHLQIEFSLIQRDGALFIKEEMFLPCLRG